MTTKELNIRDLEAARSGIDSFIDAIEGIEETGWERNRRVIGL